MKRIISNTPAFLQSSLVSRVNLYKGVAVPSPLSRVVSRVPIANMCNDHNNKYQPHWDFEDHKLHGQSNYRDIKCIIALAIAASAFIYWKAKVDENDKQKWIQDIMTNPDLIKQIKNDGHYPLSNFDEAIWSVIKSHPEIVSRITNPDNDLCDHLFDINKHIIDHLTNIDENLYLRLLASQASIFTRIPEPTPEFCMKAIKRNPQVIHYITNPTTEMYQLAMLRKLDCYSHYY